VPLKKLAQCCLEATYDALKIHLFTTELL